MHANVLYSPLHLVPTVTASKNKNKSTDKSSDKGKNKRHYRGCSLADMFLVVYPHQEPRHEQGPMTSENSTDAGETSADTDIASNKGEEKVRVFSAVALGTGSNLVEDFFTRKAIAATPDPDAECGKEDGNDKKKTLGIIITKYAHHDTFCSSCNSQIAESLASNTEPKCPSCYTCPRCRITLNLETIDSSSGGGSKKRSEPSSSSAGETAAQQKNEEGDDASSPFDDPSDSLTIAEAQQARGYNHCTHCHWRSETKSLKDTIPYLSYMRGLHTLPTLLKQTTALLGPSGAPCTFSAYHCAASKLHERALLEERFGGTAPVDRSGICTLYDALLERNRRHIASPAAETARHMPLISDAANKAESVSSFQVPMSTRSAVRQRALEATCKKTNVSPHDASSAATTGSPASPTKASSNASPTKGFASAAASVKKALSLSSGSRASDASGLLLASQQQPETVQEMCAQRFIRVSQGTEEGKEKKKQSGPSKVCGCTVDGMRTTQRLAAHASYYPLVHQSSGEEHSGEEGSASNVSSSSAQRLVVAQGTAPPWTCLLYQPPYDVPPVGTKVNPTEPVNSAVSLCCSRFLPRVRQIPATFNPSCLQLFFAVCNVLPVPVFVRRLRVAKAVNCSVASSTEYNVASKGGGWLELESALPIYTATDVPFTLNTHEAEQLLSISSSSNSDGEAAVLRRRDRACFAVSTSVPSHVPTKPRQLVMELTALLPLRAFSDATRDVVAKGAPCFRGVHDNGILTRDLVEVTYASVVTF